jgi:hypothetical protein
MHEYLRLLVFGVLFFAAVVCAVAGSFLTLSIVAEINRKLAGSAQIPAFGMWSIDKSRRVRSDYRRLYPEGRLVVLRDVLTVGMFALLVGAVLALRFLH